MPTYDYRCDKCGHQFEEFQSISAEPLKECPVCHGPVQRLIGAGNGFLFKGSGFYITDYRSESYKKAKAKENGGSTSTTSKPDKTSKSTAVSKVT
ncbi:zinc ribbon domain-containing protein [candidate division KSB1 bacterium]|nr:zinc ribbon domain-containing protein [candidate division KSB1 bacterium]